MKVAITGHSRGVGKAVADYFTEQGHEVIGYSRSSGYDLTDQKDIRRALDEIPQADLFINNFYHINLQIRLLKNVHEAWKGQEGKRIVVMGSVASEIADHEVGEYAAYKAGLDKLARNLSGKALWPRLHVLKFGVTDTAMSSRYGAHVPRMAPTDIVKVLDWILTAPEPIKIQEVVFTHNQQVLRMA